MSHGAWVVVLLISSAAILWLVLPIGRRHRHHGPIYPVPTTLRLTAMSVPAQPGKPRNANEPVTGK